MKLATYDPTPQLTRVFAIAAVLAAVMMMTAFQVYKPDGLACDHPQMVLCAELPTSGANLRDVIGAPNNSSSAWRGQIAFDFLFIFGFSGLLIAARHRTRMRPVRASGWLRLTLAGIATVAIADVCEDIGILRAVASEDGSDALATWIASAAQIKFTTLAVVVAGISATATRVRGVLYPASFIALAGAVTHWFHPVGFTLITIATALCCLTTLILTELDRRRGRAE